VTPGDRVAAGSGPQPVEIVIRLQIGLPPGMMLTAAAPLDEPLAYRIPEVAEKLGIGHTKVRELVARGEIASVLIDGARRIPADALRIYLGRLQVNDIPA
jgi:excisionase family DNA binding protein